MREKFQTTTLPKSNEGQSKQPAQPKAIRSSKTLLLKTQDVCEMLGGIHPRTLARMEKSGLIRSVKLLRHKLYAVEDIEALVAGLRNWNR